MKLIAAVAAAAALTMASAHALSAQTPTPRPDGVPAAPSNVDVHLDDGIFTWTDNSNNEDGFRLVVEVFESGTESPRYAEEHVTAANETAARAHSVLEINNGDVIRLELVAFNEAGDSAPVTLGRSLEGGLIPPTPTATSIPFLIGEWTHDATLVWPAWPGAASYSVKGRADVLRVSARGSFCDPPQAIEQREVTFESVVVQGTSFRPDLPDVGPADMWFAYNTSVELYALSDDGSRLAGSSSQHIAETMCPPPDIQLPSTGSGMSDTRPLPLAFASSLVLATGWLGLYWLRFRGR
jgi:hypothetical protein